ncbi:hypothetical protein [Lactobacillus sp. PV012]|uniref:hypothetical protein n=1 Tax=Lactobacillus sp. PV012 TaxID=2594494 RepID=UPI002240B877|nr:hypothetical protein [Lactobacillus sp. PV012]QNQ82825.1 hypothetical protein FP433_07160 [Lactobacillus sp. PV012]
MKKNNFVKILAEVSTALLIGTGISMTPNIVKAANTIIGTSTDKTVNITKDEKGTIHFEPIFSTVNVTVKENNPVILKVDSANAVTPEKSDYKAGETIKVQYSYEFTSKENNQPVKGYFIERKTIAGKEYGIFILADEVNASTSIPTRDEYSANIQTNLNNAQKEYKEKLQKEEAKQADLKKRFLYYTAKKKSSKKSSYYYTLYRKTRSTKKSTKATYTFKKNKYKIKAKSFKLETPVKNGKKIYYHVKNKSANFWVSASDVKDLKPVFRKK